MVSLGIVPFVADLEFDEVEFLDERFEMNIRELDDCGWDPDTREWWDHEDRWLASDRTFHDPKSPVRAMDATLDFLERISEGREHMPHVWAACPATFDMPYLRYYAQRFAKKRWEGLYGSNVMQRISCFDIGSVAAQVLDCSYHEVSKVRMPMHWKAFDNPLPHVAVNDAEEQAHLLVAVLRDARIEMYR